MEWTSTWCRSQRASKAIAAVACCALMGCAAIEGDSNDSVRNLSPDEAVELSRPDVVGVVERSVLERDSSLLVNVDGVLELEDGSAIEINDRTRRVFGCTRTRVDDPDSSGQLVDYSGCLAIARTNDDGVALNVLLLDRIDARGENIGLGWELTGSPAAVSDDAIVFRGLFAGHAIAIPYRGARETIRQEVLRYDNDCNGYAGLSMILAVDEAGVITSILGYGDPFDPRELQLWDGPCAGPNPNI